MYTYMYLYITGNMHDWGGLIGLSAGNKFNDDFKK